MGMLSRSRSTGRHAAGRVKDRGGVLRDGTTLQAESPADEAVAGVPPEQGDSGAGATAPGPRTDRP